MTASVEPHIVEWRSVAAQTRFCSSTGVPHGRRPALRRDHHRDGSRGWDARAPDRDERRQGAVAGAWAFPPPGGGKWAAEGGFVPGEGPPTRAGGRPARRGGPPPGQHKRGGGDQVFHG